MSTNPPLRPAAGSALVTSRNVARLALVGWGLAVAFVTMFPGARTPPLTLGEFICFACDERGTVDVLLNWLLFVPGGVLAARLWGGRRATLFAVAATCLIETLQIGIPGRDPALQDLVANSLGGWTGAKLLAHGLSSRARVGCAALIALLWLAPTILMQPAVVGETLYGLRTPALGGMERFAGQVLNARLGSVEIQTGRVDDSDEVKALLRADAPIEVVSTLDRLPVRFAPLFMISTDDQVGLVTVGAIGDDVLVSTHTVGAALKFATPYRRLRGALSDRGPGDTVTIDYRGGDGSGCLAVSSRTSCTTAPTNADGWAHFLHIQQLTPRAHGALRALWTALLGGSLGLLLGLPRGTVAGIAVGGAGYAAATAIPVLTPHLGFAAALSLAATLGGFLAPRFHGAWRRFIEHRIPG